MDMRVLVGRNVRRIRQRKGLTQERFAELSGYTQQYISDLERGRRNPTVITLFELSQALGVSHMDLVRPARRQGPKRRAPARAQSPRAGSS
ncbi:MAG: helix-turn-helix transcriptional regulator [Pseudomonadota bacterium]|nr:helix-turn-helix transcriptional regulator [Pseudomonadota bacterium]